MADVILEVTIPDAHVAKGKEILEWYAIRTGVLQEGQSYTPTQLKAYAEGQIREWLLNHLKNIRQNMVHTDEVPVLETAAEAEMADFDLT